MKTLKEAAMEARKFIYLASDRCDIAIKELSNQNQMRPTTLLSFSAAENRNKIDELEKIRTKLAEAFKQLARFLE